MLYSCFNKGTNQSTNKYMKYMKKITFGLSVLISLLVVFSPLITHAYGGGGGIGIILSGVGLILIGFVLERIFADKII